jgi:hypothetical protein
MGKFKTEAARTNKRLLRTRIEELEKKVQLLNAVTANLVREISAKEQLEKFLSQPEAKVSTTPEQGVSDGNQV